MTKKLSVLFLGALFCLAACTSDGDEPLHPAEPTSVIITNVTNNELNMAVNATYQLAVTVEPHDATSTYLPAPQDVDYSSSVTEVASISATGLITAHAAGYSTITVQARGTSIGASFTLNVSNPSAEQITTDGVEYVNKSTYLSENFNYSSYGYYGGEFNDMFGLPSSTVTTHDELVDLLDYCAYYKIAETTFTNNISDGRSAVAEINLAYWDSILCPGTVGVRIASEGANNQFTIAFSYDNNANSYVPKESDTDFTKTITPYVYDIVGNKEKITDVQYVGKGNVDVWNSDQLIYAMIKGRNPVMASNSPAYATYARASLIVKDIIYDDMSITDKALAIDNWIYNHSNYDDASEMAACYISTDHAYNTAEMSSLVRGFYAEGPLFGTGGVCIGNAKAGALLSLLSGLTIKMVHGNMNGLDNSSELSCDPVTEHEGVGYGYDCHGLYFVYNGSQNKWGVSDPTYRYAGYIPGFGPDLQINRIPAANIGWDRWASTYLAAGLDLACTRYIDVENDFVDDELLTTYFKTARGVSWAVSSEEEVGTLFSSLTDTIDLYKQQNSIRDNNWYLFNFSAGYVNQDDIYSYVDLLDVSCTPLQVPWYNYRWFNVNTMNSIGYLLAIYL